MQSSIEQQHIQRIRRWLNGNWKPLLAGLLFATVIIGGWYGYDYYTELRQEKLSDQWQQLAARSAILFDATSDDRANQRAALTKDLQAFRDAHPDTVYAQLSALNLARLAFLDAQYGIAQQQLQWVVENTQDIAIRGLARWRLAEILWIQGDDAAAIALLERSPIPMGFDALYAEMTGDIYYHQGAFDQASEAYQLALQLNPVPSPLLQRKQYLTAPTTENWLENSR